MTVSFVLFAIAALGGTALATLRLRERRLPYWLALGHGAFALAGTGVLIAVVLRPDSPVLSGVALGMIVMAVGLGAVLFVFHVTGREIPIPPILIHAMAAVSGLALLVAAMAGLG